MGKHFDTLVELLKNELPKSVLTPEFKPQEYLSRIARDFMLFEFPLKKIDILPTSGKENEEYDKYLKDYLKMSQEIAGRYIKTPFDKTAIEDPESVVFLEPKRGNGFRTTSVTNMEFLGDSKNSVMIHVADVTVHQTLPEGAHGITPISNNGLYLNVLPIYLARAGNLGRVEIVPKTKQDYLYIAEDITNATMAHFQETVYIMDPENFIIEKESNASKIQTRKNFGKSENKHKLKKTCMRPHYICLGEEDTREFLGDQSKEPRIVHPVRGYWKTLRSERYKAAKGKILQIEQYYRGTGKIDGKNGWHYQVHVKDKDMGLRAIV